MSTLNSGMGLIKPDYAVQDSISGKRLLIACMILACACVLVSAASAQTASTGAIAGTATDASGALVVGAEIKATNNASGVVRTAITGPQGNYVLPLLPPGAYKVEATKSGFKVTSFPSVQVNVTETKTLNLSFLVGTATETTIVQATGEALQTESSALGHVVSAEEVRSLPLVTRNYTQIIGLSPGVSAEVFNAGEIGRGGVDSNLVVTGSHASDNNFQMNGVEINDLQGSGHFSGGVAIPNPDSIQEFKVQTSQYDASYGRDTGANVDVITKPGTNSFHGSLWEFFRNEALNANEFFRAQNNQPRPVLRQNQFGFSLGGPFIKDKLLFFTSYQGTRQKNGVDINCSSNVVLPPLTDDRSPAALADAIGIPVDLVNPQAVEILNFKLPNGEFLVPNPQTIKVDPDTGELQGFSSFSSPCKFNEDQFVSNLDFLQSDKSKIDIRFFFANSQQGITLPQTHFTGSTLPGSPSNQPNEYRNLSLTHTYTFTPHLVNQAEFGFHRTGVHISQEVPFKYSDVGIIAPDFINNLPVVDVVGGFNIGGNGQGGLNTQNTFAGKDDLSWVWGRHFFKFGGGITRVQNNHPRIDFAGFMAFLDYPSFLAGINPLVQDIAGDLSRYFRIWDGNLYAQDNFRVTPRLTLNLGFRYERLGDFSDAKGHTSNLDVSKLNPDPPDTGSLEGFIVASNFPGTIPAGVVRSGNDLAIKGTAQNTLNPRVGFAWQLPKTDRVVLRGGYGIFHQRVFGQPYLQQLTNQPFALIQTAFPNIAGSLTDPFLGDPGAFPQFVPYTPTTDPTQLQSVLTLDQNFRPPIFQRYSLGVQTQIGKDFVAEVGYVGGRGQHLLRLRSLNQASLASPSNPIRGETSNFVDAFEFTPEGNILFSQGNVQLRAPYQGFTTTNLTLVESAGASWYNSVQASLNKRFSNGFQFLASYTFARHLADNVDSTTGANGGNLTGDQNNFRRNYGPDSFIREHRMVISGLYDFPGPRDRTSLLGNLLGGWRLAGVGTIQSGHRLSVNAFNSNNVFGTTSDFAQIVPGCRVNPSTEATKRLDQFFNTDCFTTQPVIGDPQPTLILDPTGTTVIGTTTMAFGTGFGNSPVGVVHGPGQVNTDLSLIKTFSTRWPNEIANVEFRTDFFNAFNHAQFDDPDLELTSESFGQVTNTVVNPRVIQFALKFNF